MRQGLLQLKVLSLSNYTLNHHVNAGRQTPSRKQDFGFRRR